MPDRTMARLAGPDQATAEHLDKFIYISHTVKLVT